MKYSNNFLLRWLNYTWLPTIRLIIVAYLFSNLDLWMFLQIALSPLHQLHGPSLILFLTEIVIVLPLHRYRPLLPRALHNLSRLLDKLEFLDKGYINLTTGALRRCEIEIFIIVHGLGADTCIDHVVLVIQGWLLDPLVNVVLDGSEGRGLFLFFERWPKTFDLGTLIRSPNFILDIFDRVDLQ
jgi:hypothetical protein